MRPAPLATTSAVTVFFRPSWVKLTLSWLPSFSMEPVWAPVWISTPSALVASTSFSTASASRAGKGRSATSMIVTLVPARAKTWVNSIPMTPAPMKTMDLGCSCKSRISSLVMACSNPGMGKGRGFEPVAMTVFLPTKVCPFTATSCGPVNLAGPSATWMPLFSRLLRKSSGTPSTKVCLRAMSFFQSSVAGPTEMRCSGASAIWCRHSAAATRTFFGTQPRKGQVPPISRDSTITADLPALCAAPIAAKPALPEPRTMTSTSEDIFGLLSFFFFETRGIGV